MTKARLHKSDRTIYFQHRENAKRWFFENHMRPDEARQNGIGRFTVTIADTFSNVHWFKPS